MHFNYLGGQWSQIREKVLKEIDEMGYKGDYINGKKIQEFEDNFAKKFDSKYGVGVSNGTDGLKLSLQVLDLNSEDLVIIPNNTFVANYLAVRNLPDNKPEIMFIDHDEYFTISVDDLKNFLSGNRSKYRKIVIMVVHLYGHPCDMDSLVELKNKYNLEIIEDCSQSHGTKYKDRYVGNDGIMSVYSLYPGKNLGAIGDAGIITTNDESIYNRLRALRNYGSKVKYHYDELGHNHRMDTIQSIVLSYKLEYLDEWNNKKNEIVVKYKEGINNVKIQIPKIANYCSYHSYHIFHIIVDDRNKFSEHLNKNQIPNIIHYPFTLSQTKIYNGEGIITKNNSMEYVNKIISLPIHPFMSNDEINYIINVINKY